MERVSLTPIEFCAEQTQRFIAITTPPERKKQGQFFTPPEVARFMAKLAPARSRTLRILDAGGGTGILACAVCEQGVGNRTLNKIHVDAYEDDQRLTGLLQESMEYTRKWLDKQDLEFTYQIFAEDFILANTKILWGKKKPLSYDLAIGNPPYFKIGKNDPRARLNPEFVYGQPNIYALFMGVTAEMLRNKGVMVFITPRSYTAGPYFKIFRRRFFEVVRPERVHLFESRKDAFRKDEVLQENIILKARKGGSARTMNISRSQGTSDLLKAKTYRIPISNALYSINNNDVIFRLPVNDEESRVLEAVDRWPGSLHKYGIEISTGPVVPFRAVNLIPKDGGDNKRLVPLLWMQNVRPMEVRWPLEGANNGKKKRQFIMDHPVSRKRKLLVKNMNMVLLRRFSAKEEVRRLVAAPLLQDQLPYELIGIENHLNYIYRFRGRLTEVETLGLSALLNSSLLDRYFRISNGNTQVSASELRAMPLPSMDALSQLGAKIKELPVVPTHEDIDALVEMILGV